jgi:tetratricopeptide (TPR) repeat protein
MRLRALRARYECSRAPADLDESIAASAEALETCSPAEPRRFMFFGNHGVALQLQADLTGDARLLDETVDKAITHNRVAAREGADWPELANCLASLSTSLQIRFKRLHETDDLRDAVIDARAAVDSSTPDAPAHPHYLKVLGTALWILGEESGDPAAVNEAIAVGRRVVAAAPTDGPERCSLLADLGSRLQTRFDRTRNLADIDEAIELARASLANPPADGVERGRLLNNLAIGLQSRFEESRCLADIQEAVELGREAVDCTPPTHPAMVMRLMDLGIELRTRYEATRDVRDAESAISCYDGVAATPTATASARVDAHYAAGSLAASLALEGSRDSQASHYAHTALDSYASAVDLLPLVAWPGLSRGSRERQLGKRPGIAQDAAACAIGTHDPRHALALLEAGRGVLWGQLLDANPAATDLRTHHRDLADRLDELHALTLPKSVHPMRVPEMVAWTGGFDHGPPNRYTIRARLRQARRT